MCCTRPNKVTSLILPPNERYSRYCYRAVAQISRRGIRPPIVARRRSEPRGRREKRNVTRDETSRFGPHIEPENCTALRETETRTNFSLPLNPTSSSSPPPLPPLLVFFLCRSQIYPPPPSLLSHPGPPPPRPRAGFKTKMYVPIGWPLFVRDCETRFLRKRREKLQSRFVERFD